jgi:hypothetical protein
LGVGLLAGIFFALTKGLTPREVPTRVMPNQGIRWTAQNALRVTVGIALIATLVTAFVRLPGFMVGGLVSGGLPYGLLFGLLGWMFFGGLTLIQHAALRVMLWRSGNAPLNYARFLDACVARIMLRRVGGGYMFVHRLLLAYFAELETGKIKE